MFIQFSFAHTEHFTLHTIHARHHIQKKYKNIKIKMFKMQISFNISAFHAFRRLSMNERKNGEKLQN